MEETLRVYSKRLLVFIVLMLGCGKAFAFNCKTSSYSPSRNTSATFVLSVSPGSLNKNTTSLTFIDLASYVNCYGDPSNTIGDSGKRWNDALGIESVALTSTQLTSLGFEPFVELDSDGVKRSQITPQTLCMWWYASCAPGPAGERGRNVLSTKIGIKRTVSSGAWREAVTIPAGTEVAKLITRLRSDGWINAYYTFSLVLASDLVIPATTCNVDNYNKKVILEEAKLSDIISHGVGRYTGKTTEFNYLLTCDTATSVSVKLEGTPLSSSSGPINNVLANTVDATKNIGVQVLFNNTPMSVLATDPAVKVINSAQASETLKFNAYYYYNGDSGTAAGPVKSLATITFDYF